jgi:hypothetical protein
MMGWWVWTACRPPEAFRPEPCPPGTQLVRAETEGGALEQSCRRPDGLAHGAYRLWDREGNPAVAGSCAEGWRDGEWLDFAGRHVVGRLVYAQGEVVDGDAASMWLALAALGTGDPELTAQWTRCPGDPLARP